MVVNGYVPMPWPGDHTLALRSAGGMANGSYSRRGYYYVGGYNLKNTSLLDTITTGAFNGAFVLRGYPPGQSGGRSFILQNAEYRIPLVKPDRGPSTLPLFLRRIDPNLFVDFGGAFDRLDTKQVDFFSHGAVVHSPQLYTGVGAELWFGTTLAYGLNTHFRLGFAHGMSTIAIPGGQFYFLASSAY
jgi:outer membrane protein assembly factor BamA